ADDICYSIVDMEDAHRLGILNTDQVADSFLHLIKSISTDPSDVQKIPGYYKDLDDKNEAIAFLRAKVINALTNRAADIFMANTDAMLQGNYNNTLIDQLNDESGALKQIRKLSVEKIYNHDTVIEIEIAGFNVMSELLQLLVPALLKKKPSHKEEKILRLFPYQFREFEETETPYYKVLNALDFISGMTDEYATEIYRRLKGITIPHHG
ncbi:MAG TPA: deoxyguanosinetriphosphate triphosphohydrolase, partial [Chitinophagaceae bacterium]